jgi:hypothetical protein
MDLDPSLAFTALLKMWPDAPEGESAALAKAMTAANPKDRWAFARAWVAENNIVWSGNREAAMAELGDMGVGAVSARGVLKLADQGGTVDLGCGQRMVKSPRTGLFEVRGDYREELAVPPYAAPAAGRSGCRHCGAS